MSEIRKLYENAVVKMQHLLDMNTNQFVDVYPPFTAEKQLNILKILSFRQGILLKQHRFFIGWEYNDPDKLICSENSDLNFEEGLATLVNYLWQSLTDEERNSIKEILE